MRRKEREVTEKSEIIAIIKRAKVLNLGLFNQEYPYVVPLSFFYQQEAQEQCLYFHAAKEGKKLDLIKKDPHCAFAIYTDHGVIHRSEAEQTTNYYECVLGEGRVEEVTDLDQKNALLIKLTRNYGFTQAINLTAEVLEKTFVGKVIISKLSGKANKEESK